MNPKKRIGKATSKTTRSTMSETINNIIKEEEEEIITCNGCQDIEQNGEFEEDIDGEKWCANCYAGLKDKFKKSYTCNNEE